MHDIEKASDMFAARQAPWHDTYTAEPELLTVEQAHQQYFAWEPELQPLVTLDAAGSPLPVEHHCAVVRNDNNRVLGVVGRQYGVIGNDVIARNAAKIAGDGACVETGGNIRGGAQVWYLISVGDSYRINGDSSAMKSYLLFSSAHDGSRGYQGLFTDVRVVCANTLALALGGRSQFNIRHTSNGEIRAEEAADLLAEAVQHQAAFRAWANHMANNRWSLPLMRELAKQLLPAKDEADVPTVTANNRERMVELFEAGDGHDSIRGTAWAAINAVSQWCDHERTVRGKSDEQRRDNRLQSIWFGQSAATKRKAASIITDVLESTVPAGPAGAVAGQSL